MRTWTPAEDRTLRVLYPEFSARHIAQVLGRTKAAVKGRTNMLGLRKSANSGRFKPGHVGYVAPKGTRNSPRTEFKKGNKPQTWVPIGSETTDREGYLKRKVSDERTEASRFNWRFVHRMVWEEHHGPIPRGHKIVFRDGNKQNIVIENLELVTYREAMRRNTIQRYPADLVQTMQLLGKVRKRIKRTEEKAA